MLALKSRPLLMKKRPSAEGFRALDFRTEPCQKPLHRIPITTIRLPKPLTELFFLLETAIALVSRLNSR